MPKMTLKWKKWPKCEKSPAPLKMSKTAKENERKSYFSWLIYSNDLKCEFDILGGDSIERSPNWCIVEKVAQYSMERIMEDNESVLETVSEWSPNTENMIVFSRRKSKFSFFNDPTHFLITAEQKRFVATLSYRLNNWPNVWPLTKVLFD